MAQKVITRLIDDLDGSEIEDGSGRTISFAFDGEAFEIDLNGKHLQEMTAALGPFMSAARRPGSQASGTDRAAKGPTPGEVRLWAMEHGYEVSKRGRLSANVVRAFRTAMGYEN
jgi:hypothetical protein